MRLRMSWGRCGLAIVMAYLTSFASAVGADEPYVPPALEPWMDWVLEQEPTYQCPLSSTDDKRRVCAWPSLLTLSLNDRTVQFTAKWRVYADVSVRLPGNARNWPLDVKVNGQSAIVVKGVQSPDAVPVSQLTTLSKGKRSAQLSFPRVTLKAGTHRIIGRIQLFPSDDVLPIPSDTAQVSLMRDGKSIQPFIDGRGVWLKKEQQQAQTRTRDEMDVRVFRRLTDDQMTLLETQLQLRVSGSRREVVMGPSIIPQGFQVTQVSSGLPARVDKDGKLRLQVKPGNWNVMITMRSTAEHNAFELPTIEAPWPSSEIWSVRTRPARRAVRVDGDGVPMDPQHTQMPGNWRGDSAYQLTAGQRIELVELQRGNASPNPNQLSMDRSVWLDFDGDGLTLRDYISGQFNQGWQLKLSQPFQLSRLSLREEPAVVRQYNDQEAGVEIRRHQVNADAVSRLELPSSIITALTFPASGWNETLSNLKMELNLPPGWRLLGMNGADSVSRSWLNAWDLWDVFLLMIMVSLLRSGFGNRVAALGAVTMVVLFHEPGVPEKLWVTVAFLAWCGVKVNHQWANKAIMATMVLAVIPLVFATLPFLVNQARIVMHPQLDGGRHAIIQSHSSYSKSSYSKRRARSPAAPQAEMVEMEYDMADDVVAESSARTMMKSVAEERAVNRVQQAHRTAIQEKEQGVFSQTGASVPQWRWRSAQFTWNGPVTSEQNLTVYLLNPFLTVFLALVRIVLVVAFTAMLFKGWWTIRRTRKSPSAPSAGGAVAAGVLPVMTLLLGMMSVSPQGLAADNGALPSKQLLSELKTRLTQPPECWPACSSVGAAHLVSKNGRWQLDFAVMADGDSVVPLPIFSDTQRQTKVLLNGKPATSVMHGKEGHELFVERGRHRVTLVVPMSNQRMRIRFPQVPPMFTSKVSGWSVEGLNDGRLLNDSVTLNPDETAVANDEGETLAPTVIKPLVSVVRRIAFNQDWVVNTTVIRVAPNEGAINMVIPLLDGERVMSEGASVHDDGVRVALGRTQHRQVWQSKLPVGESLTLQAPQSGDWMETWMVTADERWGIVADGVIEDKPQQSHHWQPVWTPRAGETLTLAVQSLALTPGESITVDGAHFKYQPGDRVANTEASIQVRNTTGQELKIKLPEDAEIQSLTVNGSDRPVRIEEGVLRILLSPGNHTIEWNWRDNVEGGFSLDTPTVEFEQPVSNIQLAIQVPRDQWLLWVRGPDLGPAILYWGELLAVLILAVLLGRVPQSPLKTPEWVLLGLGLSAQNLWAAGAVAVVMFALAWRPLWRMIMKPVWHNVLQIVVCGVWVFAMLAVMLAVPAGLGLFGSVDMGVTGNGSYAGHLKWYQDMSTGVIPQASAIVVPMWVYRVLMLAWSLWLARALVRWALWSWAQWSNGGIMLPVPLRVRKKKAASSPDTGTTDSASESETESNDSKPDGSQSP